MSSWLRILSGNRRRRRAAPATGRPGPCIAFSAQVRRRWTGPLLVAAVACGIARSGPAVEERVQRGSTARRSGTEVRAVHLDLVWADLPVRQALQSLAEAQAFCILLDRRVDPERRVDLAVKNEPIDLILRRTAVQIGAEVSWVDSVAYLGPSATALKLRTLVELRREELKNLPADARKALSLAAARRWPQGQVARELVVESCGALIVNTEAIPHDLWPAGSLPKMRLVDQLSLWLGQFDLTYEPTQDGRLRLRPIPDEVTITRSYAASAQPATRIGAFRAIAPGATIARDRDQIVVSAAFEEHEQIRALLSGQSVKKTKVAAGQQVYTLKFQNVPLERALDELSRQLQRPIELSDAARRLMLGKSDRPISVNVQKASLAELMNAVLETTELTFREMGERIVIKPREQ